MKHKITILCVVCMLLVPSISFSAQYMLGVRTGFYAWQPFLKAIGASGMDDIDWGTGVLYGPVMSIRFTEDLSLSLSALLGQQSTSWQSQNKPFESNMIFGDYSFTVYRADVDSALSYALGQYFKIFAGYKYQYLKLDYKFTEIRTNSSLAVQEISVFYTDNAYTNAHGPALGIGLNYPLSETYFFSVNVSALYMWGTFYFKSKRFAGNITPLVPQSGDPIDLSMYVVGFNVEPVIGINPGNSLPIVILGARCQLAQFNLKDTQGELPDKGLDDTILGIFVSIVYMF